MSRSPRWSLLAVFAVVAIVFAACTPGATSPSPSSPTATQASQPPASTEPFTGTAYPESGEAPCGQAEAPSGFGKYTGEFKKITAQDARTVVFELCSSDVAFLSKIAFTSFAINDTGWLESKIDPAKTENQDIVSMVNGTGPYSLTSWDRGSQIVMTANPNYWGEAPKSQTLVFRWGTEAAQRLTELSSGTVDGIDNVAPEDFATVQANADLKLEPREGLNVLYIGMNNNPKVEGFDNSKNPFANEKVRQAIAMGIDRQRITDQFYPPGSEVATHFTPCSIPNGCTGDAWYDFDAPAAKQLLADAGYPNGFTTKISYRNVARGYLPNPPAVAQDLQQQLKTNLNIDATLDEQESTTFIDNSDAGRLDGLYLLGWGADYPDVTNFLDFHFGSGATDQFGDKFDDITGALSEGAAGADDAAREPSYVTANNAIRTHVPMVPVVHGGSAVAYRADVQDTHASPLGNEYFGVMTPGDRSQFVWMQNAEPGGLYCADESDGESLRVCEQVTEALYAYEVGGTAAEPALAEACEPNAELTVWTCTLREATFHDGATLDANDVVLSYAVQWDTQHELHKGRDGSFSYFPGLFGGFLNPPPPEE
ncbi:MAG TPA: ABC transporter substrate-binding protein [Candidatus Limnocylindrales bacterium]|nr:ABC transporter substrate-binding protein [Candidatus Limnocylindrales bacterium]